MAGKRRFADELLNKHILRILIARIVRSVKAGHALTWPFSPGQGSCMRLSSLLLTVGLSGVAHAQTPDQVTVA